MLYNPSMINSQMMESLLAISHVSTAVDPALDVSGLGCLVVAVVVLIHTKASGKEVLVSKRDSDVGLKL